MSDIIRVMATKFLELQMNTPAVIIHAREL